MTKNEEAACRPAVASKVSLGGAALLNIALLAALFYLFGAVGPHLSRPVVETVGLGMMRDEVIAVNGMPTRTVLGPTGNVIDKFTMPGGWILFVFYDEDTRVSSFIGH